MASTDIRQKLHQQIDQLPSDLLELVAEFLEFLKFKRARSDAGSIWVGPSPTVEVAEPASTESTGGDLLQFAGTWHGEDFEECLQAVYENRSLAEF
ncbi:MAG: hypothetical protein AAFQ61_03095 [Cyanobacteria bacterium J06626_23]